MDPISTIAAVGTALASIKTAIEITQTMKASELSYTEAEYKLKLADIYNSLADAKMSIAEFKELLISKDEQIKILEEKVKEKENLQYNEKYQIYESMEDSSKILGKYCTRCYDDEKKLIRLDEQENGFMCKKCKTFYRKPEFYVND